MWNPSSTPVEGKEKKRILWMLLTEIWRSRNCKCCFPFGIGVSKNLNTVFMSKSYFAILIIVCNMIVQIHSWVQTALVGFMVETEHSSVLPSQGHWHCCIFYLKHWHCKNPRREINIEEIMFIHLLNI